MRISVIIPVYNAGKTLEACVRSTAEQEWPEIEVILIDDGSTDGTVLLAETLVERYPFVHLMQQEHGGASRARNLGLTEAGGECVLFLDADDLLMPGALKALAEWITEESDACCGRILRGTEKETGRTSVTGILHGDALINEALARPTDLLSIHGWLFRKKIFTENGIRFDPGLRLGEDSEMVLKYLGACRGATLISQAVCRYMIAPESTIHKWKEGQTESYLQTIETVRQTAAGQMRNWPLYVLTTLLLILTHDTFHPANPAGRREQFAEARRLRALPVMDEAFREADLGQMEKLRRQVLTWLKDGQIWPAWAAIRIRQRQNARRAGGRTGDEDAGN